MATKRFCRSVSLLLLQLLLCWSALTIDETATSASQGEESDYRVFHRDQILYPTKAEDKSNAVDDQKVLRQLAAIYASSIRPAERQSHYSSLGISRSTLTETTLFAKPSILFVGPWSTGKTTTINYLLGDHKNDRLLRGVEPTTSHFTAINYGERAGQTDGLILAADPEHPLTQLEQFGQRALQHVTELQLPHRLLANLTLVDTPGMFENQAQRERGYSYDAMLGWFAHRADLIVVMFDPARVEVGHEMSRLFRRVSARHPSVRIVLNKADSIDEEQLMRIYGALLWSLSPLVNASEPPRVYLSSLWSRPHQGQPAFKRLLQRDEQALLTDIRLTIEDGVRNKIALVRRQAQRVRMHYIMVDAIVQTYRRYKGADEQQNSRLLADMIANPTKYGILKAAMERANGVYEEPDANEYTAYFKTISIDDHHTTDELCANDSHCHFLQLQDAIDVRLTDLIRGYGASRKVAVDSDNDEPTDGENADENDNDEAAEALSSNVEAVAEVPDQPADTDEQEEEQEETGDHSHEEQLGDDDDDEDTSSELNENHGNKTEDESSAEMHDYTPPTPSDYVAEASGPFLFAGAAASNPPDRKKKRHEEKTEEVEEIAADDDENEEPNKIKCHYRKSCYETGKVPELGHDIFVAPVSVKAKQKSEESDKEDDDEELSEQKKKLSCKYRKSCYDTGVLPDLNKESEAAVARNQAEKEAAALINHYTTPELRCRYRKSCYETGVVPQLKPQIVVPRSSKAPEDKKDDEETEDDDDEENIKLRCKYRKSCYDTGVLPDLNKESEAAVARKQAEKEAAALINHYTTPELRCRYRKSCYETGQLPEQFKAAPQPAKAEKEHHHRTHKHDTNPKEKHDKPSAPKAARRSDSERSTARTKHHKTHRTVQPKDKKLEERRKQKRSAAKEPELVEVATLPADVMKLQCRYRYSCYRTGVLVLNAPTAEKEHVDASATDEHDEEPDEEPSEDEIKLRCKYRKSCYASHGLEVKLDEHKEAVEEEDVDVEEMQKARLQLIAKWILHTLKEEEAEAQERPKPVDVHTPLTEANEKLDAKIRCHYRKSCYETGVVPQLEPQIVFTRSSKASEDKKDDEETEDDDDDDEDNIKLRCKYRKSCYDTGVLPDLNKENEEAVARKEAEEEAAALVNRYTTPELRCRYRKSCYETGQLPEQFYAASEPQDEEEESLTERIFTEAIPTTIDE
uniref:Dynamin-type G domain-containing protein n=1 Tax=Plectus sambesii TaxID=2011161 RepID=A0A914XEI0_9BILA